MSQMPTIPQEVKKPEENKETEPKKSILKQCFESFIWLAVILFVIDVLTKVAAYYNLPYQTTVKVSGFEWLFQLTLTFNTGAAFGAGGDNMVARILLCFASYAVAIFIIVYFIKKQKTLTKFLKAIMMVILAGDVGNLIDRTFSFMTNLPTIYAKGVIDFIDITPIIPNFGIFNFADSCLCVGIFLLIVYEVVEMIRDDLKKKSPKKDEK